MDLVLILLSGVIFVFFVVLFVRTSCKYIKENELNVLANASILFLVTIISGAVFFTTLSDWTASPVVSSCERIVTQQGDTIFEFHDSSRYCKSQIEIGDTSTVFTIRKTMNTGLQRRDACLHCNHKLWEHSRTQTIGPYEDPADWDCYLPY